MAGSDSFEAERLRRRRRVRISSDPVAEVVVDTAENTALRKLEWYQRGGGVSDRQWRDVMGVIRAQGEHLDRPYLDDWSSRLGVASLLDRAFQESTSD